MKKIITTVFCTALALCSGLTVYAAENLDRDDIEAEIWENMWNGKGDNGLDFPEASYKHHLLDKWLDENYGSEDYDWTEIGELQYEYKDYYRRLIEDWDFEDDNEGGWTINTEDNHYSFFLLLGDCFAYKLDCLIRMYTVFCVNLPVVDARHSILAKIFLLEIAAS